MRHDLPAAAVHHPEWPIRLDHCFGRVILDAICGAPWREVVAPPAWRHLTPDQLARAVHLADAILADEADLAALNRASLALRRSVAIGR
ncbi:GCN5-related N-acetyltransferase [Caulobacter sp. S45]|uniref:GCN5-related N-acetyltransferase n=1 Tax=Caulobacter sp. S45 TaxID=1641861 RepID=UPI0015752710|nr:GCN5-related N-acetyltransferase [Caulobacter sp. S45]